METTTGPQHPDAQRRDASCVGISNDDAMLLVRTVAYPRFWQPLGGQVDPGEHPRDAAVREAYEEAGFTLEPSTLTHIVSLPLDVSDGEIHFYHATSPERDIRTCAEEILEYRWVTATEAAELPTLPAARAFLDRWCHGRAPVGTGYTRAESEPHTDHRKGRSTMVATIFVPLSALNADDTRLEELGARNVHFGRLEHDAGEIQVNFEYDPETTSVGAVFKYLTDAA
jgi:8-oxo-dGTP pyrophosphatase MutT (NUDIX family)